jgi:uncharacterized lipoprotein YbaY/heat shock protein HslJ/uncharacterized lipoprotein NlpE involved in copper resistance
MRWIAFLTLAFATVAAFAAGAAEGHVTGTASYSERIALPPGAVFEAILEDVSAADAPAIEVGRTTVEDPGTPPFQFEIDYDPTAIDPANTYSVRTQVSVGRRLIFVSTAMNPVLTGGAGSEVAIRMMKVGDTAEEVQKAPVQIGAHGLRLPASFAGDLPCTDCKALRFQLNLWSDQVFHLRRTWVGTDARRDSIGRWSVDPDRQALVLRGADEELQFQILGPDQLRLLGHEDAPVESDLGYELSASPTFEPFEPHLPLRGMLTYVADAARFTECLTGRDYPLAKEGDYAALEHAYLAAGAEPGGPIMASFDGGIVQRPAEEDAGTEPQVLVERFVGVWPGETCERATGAPSLTNTYWKILRLGDTEVTAAEGHREPNLILRAGDPRFTATVGCNQMSGGYRLDDDKLGFGPTAATRMACPAPLDGWERQLAEALTATAGWRIDGQTLELLDAAGESLALFQAVYLY